MFGQLSLAGRNGRKIVRPQDVFTTSAYFYSAGGATLPFAPDFVWIKNRNQANDHFLIDTVRGNGRFLSTNSVSAEQNSGTSRPGIIGNSFGDPGYGDGNIIAWALRRKANIFDIVTYTGDGASTQTLPHLLGSVPGMILGKARNAPSDWCLYHRGWGPNIVHYLNTGGAARGGNAYSSAPTSTSLTVGAALNSGGVSYELLVFGHNTDPNWIIQCGTVLVPSGGSFTPVDLGGRAQFVMIVNSGTGGGWRMQDTTRGMTGSSSNPVLYAGSTAAEVAADTQTMTSTPTGFAVNGFANTTYTYIAIRAPF